MFCTKHVIQKLFRFAWKQNQRKKGLMLFNQLFWCGVQLVQRNAFFFLRSFFLPMLGRTSMQPVFSSRQPGIAGDGCFRLKVQQLIPKSLYTYLLVNVTQLWNMTHQKMIYDSWPINNCELPINNGDFPWLMFNNYNVEFPEGNISPNERNTSGPVRLQNNNYLII